MNKKIILGVIGTVLLVFFVEINLFNHTNSSSDEPIPKTISLSKLVEGKKVAYRYKQKDKNVYNISINSNDDNSSNLKINFDGKKLIIEDGNNTINIYQ